VDGKVRWATRRHCHVDRAACAWLIKRFLDHEATFVFVDDRDDVPGDATPFDMRGAELSHHGGDCSFETFLKVYELADDALEDIARIVHEADIGDERYDAPEGPGLDVLIRGLALTLEDDELVRITNHLFDGLYEYRLQANSSGRIPA
jgi:hypothetical protein